MSTASINKTKKRGRGRPKSEDKLLIDSERAQFRLKSKIINISEEALETVYRLMTDVKAPPQVQNASARMVLEMASELHKQLIESEASEEIIDDVVDQPDDLEEKGIVVNFGG